VKGEKPMLKRWLKQWFYAAGIRLIFAQLSSNTVYVEDTRFRVRLFRVLPVCWFWTPIEKDWRSTFHFFSTAFFVLFRWRRLHPFSLTEGIFDAGVALHDAAQLTPQDKQEANAKELVRIVEAKWLAGHQSSDLRH